MNTKKPKKIAIIDDQKQFANGILRIIEEKLQYHDVALFTEPEAILNFTHDGYGLIVVDYRLFDGFAAGDKTIENFPDGLQIMEKLRAAGYEGIFIFYTGDVETVDRFNDSSLLRKFITLFDSDKPTKDDKTLYAKRGNIDSQRHVYAVIEKFINQFSDE